MASNPADRQTREPLSKHGLFVIMAASAIALLDTALAAPALPEIARIFGNNAQTEPFARWLMSIISILPGETSPRFLIQFVMLSNTALFILVGAPIMGWICDYWGRKRLLVLSMMMFIISGTSVYFSDSILYFYVARSILGLSIAGLKTSTVALVGDHYEGAARAKVIGWQGAAFKMTGVAFLLFGGFLANFRWQVPFLGYLLALLILPSAIWALKETVPKRRTVDIVPVSEITSLSKDVPFWPTSLIFVSAILASGFFFVTLVQLPFFLEDQFQVRPFHVGAAVALGNTVGGLTAFFYGYFRKTFSYPGIYAVDFLSLSIGYFVLTIAPNYWVALLGMLIAGVGFGLYIPNQSSWIMAVVPERRRGFGVGLVTTGMFLGQFFAPFLVRPFTDVADPTAVWRSISLLLLGLFVLYVLLARHSSLRGVQQAEAGVVPSTTK